MKHNCDGCAKPISEVGRIFTKYKHGIKLKLCRECRKFSRVKRYI